MSDTAYVGNRISTLDVSRQFDSYSKVIIHVSDDTVIEVGTDAGRTLELDNPYGTQQMAQDILTRLQGYQYQPYTADGTILNPAAEIGDALSSTKVYGGIYARSTTFGRLMKSDVSAPCDEEIDHEYAYETPEQREFKRQIDDVRASLQIANDNIDARVTQTGGDQSSFGWNLTASGFSLYSNGQTVMSVTPSQVTFTGIINATAGGTIGGFTIGSNAIYKTISSMSAGNTTGVYLGTDGIKLGQNFTVNSSGNVTANNMVLKGTLTIGDSTITANDLRVGAQRANSGYSSWNGTTSTVNSNSSTWTNGASRGTSAYNTWQSALGSGVSGSITAGGIVGGSIKANSSFICPATISMGGKSVYCSTLYINGTSYNVVRWR